MTAKDKKNSVRLIQKWVSDHPFAFVLGAATGLGLTLGILYLAKRRKFAFNKTASQMLPNLNMERYVFDIPGKDNNKQVIVEGSGECYSVKLNGKFLGTMWQDQENGMQWQTHDKDLQHYLADIAAAFSGAFSRNGYPAILKGTYPQIIQTEWKTDETLEVIISEETEMEVFTTFLEDEAPNLVDFEEHLDLIIKKAGNPYFKIIGIN